MYTSNDIDAAVDIFTSKFRSVLNQHAPWIIFQLRKSFCPWLTEATKELMTQRDLWKVKARDLASANPAEVTVDQEAA